MAPSSVESQVMATIPGPRSVRPADRPVAYTEKPAAARPRATPLPTPRVAPVTSATFSFAVFILSQLIAAFGQFIASARIGGLGRFRRAFRESGFLAGF